MKSNFLKSASKHSPVIYTTLAIISLGAAVGMAVYGTIKSKNKVDAINQEREEKEKEPMTKKDIIKECWPYYLPVAGFTILSAGLMCKSTSVSLKRLAAMSTLYNVTSTTLKDYKESVKEVVGDEKAKEIKKKVDQKTVERAENDTKVVLLESGDGDYRCYDRYGKRFFMSTKQKIEDARNKANQQLILDMYMSINEFYDYLNLSPVDDGYEYGFNLEDGLIEIEPYADFDSNGHPIVVMDFDLHPRYDYSKLM